MNYRLIMIPNPIVVSDEKIEEGDLYLDDTYTVRTSFTNDEYYWSIRPEYKKIITGIEGLPKLDLSLVADEIGWVDVEKLAKDETKIYIGHDSLNTELFIKGFKAAQSLNEKNYTKTDLVKAMTLVLISVAEKKPFMLDDMERACKELSQPKEYLVEVQTERARCPEGDDGLEDVYTPKITNNSITVTKILK